MIYRLIPGFFIIPISYWFYTTYSLPRFRCHVPSWSLEGAHFLFELAPYVFILTSFTLLFRTARYALLHSAELINNVTTLALAFQFSVFTFAVGYYQFGLMIEPDIYEYIASILLRINAADQNDLVNELAQFLAEPFTGTLIAVQDGELSVTHAISTNIWDYVLYSLSAPLGDDKITNVTLCPNATLLRVLQDFSNIAFGVLSVIILVRFEPQSLDAKK